MLLLQVLYNASISLFVSGISRLVFGVPPLKRPREASLQSLPNELLLEIFSFLELKPYIICHGVCKDWRELLPLTQMHSTRKRLLDLYHRIFNTPDFQKTLEWTDQNLQPFGREEYIRCLLTQYPVIPEEFRMWILEWPARLVIQCTWPGLPFTHCQTASRMTRREGVNWIAYRSSFPMLSSLVYKHKTPSQTLIPGLFIWRFATETHWLIFAQDDPELFGRVFIPHEYYHSVGSIPFYPHREDIGDSDEDTDGDSEFSEGEEYLTTFNDWISYLEYLWNETAKEILHPSRIFLYQGLVILQPVQYNFNRGSLECQGVILAIDFFPFDAISILAPLDWHSCNAVCSTPHDRGIRISKTLK